MNKKIHNNGLVKQLANKVDALATYNKILDTQFSYIAQQQAATTSPTGVFLGQP